MSVERETERALGKVSAVKKGDVVFFRGSTRTISHIKKSRQYAGFYQIQFTQPLPNGEYAVNVRGSDYLK